jgi:4-amino-4-deoxy-L-arabinose transferase-like glycosyltransferase
MTNPGWTPITGAGYPSGPPVAPPLAVPPTPPATSPHDLLSPVEVAAVEVPPVVPTRFARLVPEVSLALGALVLNAWSLSRNEWGNTYYAAAARSMTRSWKNFFYGALDPGGWITVDKPPFALWFQAASAKLFGFSSWSILLPSAVAGALAVYLLTVTVRRVWGRTAGLIAGATLMLTPTVLAVSRSNNPDATLMLCAVAAAWATERAISTRRGRWMVLAGAFCGMAFLTKLLAAGLVMPGMWLAYLLVARVSWRARVGHLALATLTFVAVAGVWVVAADLVPVGDRPYIGGSTDGTATDLILGYNGLGRVSGGDGNRGGGFGGGFANTSAGGFSVDEFGGTPGIGRLFNNGMGDQVMWLFPVAVTAAIAGAVVAARRRRLDPRLGSIVLFGGWAAVTYLVFAEAQGTYHNYYVSLLAPALAALVGAGTALAREHGRTGRVVAAGAIALTAALQLHLLQRIEAYTALRTFVPVGLALGVISWLMLAGLREPPPELVRGTLAATVLIALAAPAIWSYSGTQHAQSGTFPDARPTASSTLAAGPAGRQPPGALALPGRGQVPNGQVPNGQIPNGQIPNGRGTARGGAAAPGGFNLGSFLGGAGGLDDATLTWLRDQRTTEKWLVAVSSSMQASAAIIAGDSVMAMGGFSGSDPAMTQARLAKLVRDGDLRFVQAGGGGFGGFGGNGGGGGGGGGGASVTTVVTQACTAVSATRWAGTGTSSIYDCQGKADAIAAVGGR